MTKFRFAIYLLLSFSLLYSCSKTTNDNEAFASYKTYFPIKVGDTYLYRLDSVIALPFGVDTITRTYYQKDSVISVELDGENQPTYRIFSYIKPYTSTSNSWTYITAYNYTLKRNLLEKVDANNLRFIKLSNPISTNHTWDGNAYFVTGTTVTSNFSDPKDVYINYKDHWLYSYDQINAVQTFHSYSFDSTITVDQINYPTGSMSSGYYSNTIFEESYEKGVGLIHQKNLFLLWQSSNGYSSYSYGVELTRIQ